MNMLRTTGLSLLAVAALGLSACGGNDNQDAVKDAQKAGEALQETAEQAKQQLDQVREQADKAQQDATAEADVPTQDAEAVPKDAQDAAAAAAEVVTSQTAKSLREGMHKQLREIEQKVKSGQISDAEGQQEAGKLTREITQKLMESMTGNPGE